MLGKLLTLATALSAILCAVAAHADGPVQLRIGWAQVGHVTPMYDVLAKRHPDLFPHSGKSYLAEGVRFNGSTPQIQAMAVGELEIAAFAPSSFTLALTNAQLDVRLVSDLIQDGKPGWFDEPFVVRKDGPIKKIEDVKGKRVATNAIGSASDNAMRIMLRKHGLQDAAFTSVEANFANMFAMIEQDKVDLIAALPQSLKEIKDAGRYRTLFTAGEARGPAQTVAWAMRTDFIKAHRPALVDFFEDHLRALHWFLDAKNHAEAVEIAVLVSKQKPEELGYFFTKDDFYRDPRGMLDLAAAQQEIADSVKLGLLPKPIEIRDHVDTSLIEEANKRING